MVRGAGATVRSIFVTGTRCPFGATASSQRSDFCETVLVHGLPELTENVGTDFTLPCSPEAGHYFTAPGLGHPRLGTDDGQPCRQVSASRGAPVRRANRATGCDSTVGYRSRMSGRGTPPHFLCIGAQKAGTQWLYDQTSSHPDVWMPAIKELRFWFGRWGRARREALAKLNVILRGV